MLQRYIFPQIYPPLQYIFPHIFAKILTYPLNRQHFEGHETFLLAYKMPLMCSSLPLSLTRLR